MEDLGSISGFRSIHNEVPEILKDLDQPLETPLSLAKRLSKELEEPI